MTWRSKQTICHTILLMAMLLTSIPANAQELLMQDCEKEESCLHWGTRSTAILLGGALLAGGVAVAALSKQRDGGRGPKGHTGPTGPAQPDFTTDEGQTLTVNFERLNVILGSDTIGTVADLSIVPYVIAPNGDYFEGEITNVVIPIQVSELFAQFASLIIPNPVFGNYEIGVQINFNEISSGNVPTTLTFSSINLVSTVIASRDDSTTIASEIDVVIATIDNGNQTQYSADFAYNPHVP